MTDDQKAPSVTGHDPDLEKMGNRSQEDAERDMRADEAAMTTEEGLGESNPVGGSASAGGMADVGTAIEEMGLGKDKDGEDPQPVLLGVELDRAQEANQKADPDDGEDEDHEE